MNEPLDDVFYAKVPMNSAAYEEIMAAATSVDGVPLPSFGRSDARYFADVTWNWRFDWIEAKCFRAGALKDA